MREAFVVYMDTGVTPDILTTAKALGNGFPIGAMLTTEALAAHFKVGVHGTTYGGNPLASAIADKVVELVSDPALLAGVAERGERIRAKLRELDGKHGLFSEICGKGLLLGAELKPAFAGRAKDFVTAAAEHGVIMLIAGPDVLRFVPSLVIPLEVLDEGLERFARGRRRGGRDRGEPLRPASSVHRNDDAIRTPRQACRSRRTRADGPHRAAGAALAAARPSRAGSARGAVRGFVSRRH